jgi:NAD(P)-dependent dehydrogenase (short-subunit alcohol dehydrogenase family)
MSSFRIFTVYALLLLSSALGMPASASEATGKVAIVTGSSYGLGKELALLAHEQGMKLVLVDIRPEPSRKLAEQFRENGGEAIVVEADLARAEQRPQVIESALEAFGRIDYLFNNAGYSYLATLEQMTLEEAHHLFEVNYWAYADLAQRVIGPMRKIGGGTIVNTASILGVRPSPPGLGHYGATKHALLGLFQTVAQEVAADNIKVIIAAPAGMKTHVSLHSTGPLSDPTIDRAADWEDPAIAARDIFTALEGDEVVIYPGYIGREMRQE